MASVHLEMVRWGLQVRPFVVRHDAAWHVRARRSPDVMPSVAARCAVLVWLLVVISGPGRPVAAVPPFPKRYVYQGPPFAVDVAIAHCTEKLTWVPGPHRLAVSHRPQTRSVQTLVPMCRREGGVSCPPLASGSGRARTEQWGVG